ncbi:hypothetical protein HMPREF0322_03543 [Desulfitobacterium hafniense DP7]|uniref:Uncharacterized protein n=1 Tax=Desulfitobacterium hafniense DP7 TaxID=537010 RepID=G9XRE5_DESHA|nr:hypothetical protein HMPREF0322_03543 [Desulfitobacterium hafniense DP7]
MFLDYTNSLKMSILYHSVVGTKFMGKRKNGKLKMLKNNL